MKVLRFQVPNEVQSHSESPTSNFKNSGIRAKAGRLSKEFEYISATSPWLTIVAMMLFNEQLTRAGQSSVVIGLIAFIVRNAFVPEIYIYIYII